MGVARFGIGGGGRVLRGGVSAGRGGLRGGVGVGPFSFSGGSRRRGSGDGLELFGEAFGPFFVALLWIAAALLAFGLLGPIALAVAGYLVATKNQRMAREITWERLRRTLGLNTPRLSRLHAVSLICAEVALLTLSIATNVAISILVDGARGDNGSGDTGLSNVVISVLLANLLLSVPIMITSWIVVLIRIVDPNRLNFVKLRNPEGHELLRWTRPTLVGAFSGIVYGIVAGSVGNVLLTDGNISLQDQLTRNIPVVATAIICLASGIQLIRCAEIGRILYFTTPIALASAAIAFPQVRPLGGEGNFGLVLFIGWIIVIGSTLAIAASIAWSRQQLLWRPFLAADQATSLGAACSISLLIALWSSNPFSIGAAAAVLGPIYASAKRTGRLAPALVLGSISAVTLRCWSVIEFQWQAHWGVLGAAGIFFGVLTGALMTRPLILSPSERIPRKTRDSENGTPKATGQRSETLTCAECGINWQRIRTSGRKPSRCPDCRVVI